MQNTNPLNYVGAWVSNPYMNPAQAAAMERRTAAFPDAELYQRPYVLGPAQADVNPNGKFEEVFRTCLLTNQIGPNDAEGIRDCANAALRGPAWYL